MAKFTFSATVNYPETEADTPTFENLDLFQTVMRLHYLLTEETDLTSCLITIVKQKED